MNKQYKIQALRKATAALYAFAHAEKNLTIKYELEHQARIMFGKAYKLGGDFDRYSGKELQ